MISLTYYLIAILPKKVLRINQLNELPLSGSRLFIKTSQRKNYSNWHVANLSKKSAYLEVNCELVHALF